MYVKDTNGRWYEVEEHILKTKEIDGEELQEVILAERAEKRKKVVDIISKLDNDELQILYSELFDLLHGSMAGVCPECQCPECPCPECSCPECHCPECVDPLWGGLKYENWGYNYNPGWYGRRQYFNNYNPTFRRANYAPPFDRRGYGYTFKRRMR